MKQAISRALKCRAAAAGGGLLVACNSLPSMCAEVNDRPDEVTAAERISGMNSSVLNRVNNGDDFKSLEQLMAQEARTRLEQDVLSSSMEIQSQHWTMLGVAGGGTVGGVQYSGKQCFEKAVGLNDKSPAAWTHLGVEEGGTPRLGRLPDVQDGEVMMTLSQEEETDVQEKVLLSTADHCSQRQCFEKALELDPNYLYAWTYLGVSGGGAVGGVTYSKKQCHEKAAELVESGWELHQGSMRDHGMQSGDVTVMGDHHKFPAGGIAWTLLALEGGGRVHGIKYSEMQCHQKALQAAKMASQAMELTKDMICSIQ